MAKIIGNTTATPNPRPDWNQTDETKADYIKNKPTILTEEDVVELIGTNGGTQGGVTVETDPTVPNWAKESEKPKYNASEIEYINENLYDQTGTVKAALDEAVGFVTSELPELIDRVDNIKIPTKMGELENDKNYVTEADLTDYAKSEIVPNSAALEDSTLKMQRVDGENTVDLFSVELPHNDVSGVPQVFYCNDWVGTTEDYDIVFYARNIYPQDITPADNGAYIISGGAVYETAKKSGNYYYADKLVDISPMPTVTTSDNGKFLRVVNGKWSAVAIDSAEGVEF